VIAGFFAAAIVGSFCNFLTVIYIGNACRASIAESDTSNLMKIHIVFGNCCSLILNH
jgi:hypothetical protein